MLFMPMKNLSFTEEDLKIIESEMKKQGMYFVEGMLPEKNGCVRVVDKNGTEKYVSMSDVLSFDNVYEFDYVCRAIGSNYEYTWQASEEKNSWNTCESFSGQAA